TTSIYTLSLHDALPIFLCLNIRLYIELKRRLVLFLLDYSLLTYSVNASKNNLLKELPENGFWLVTKFLSLMAKFDFGRPLLYFNPFLFSFLAIFLFLGFPFIMKRSITNSSNGETALTLKPIYGFSSFGIVSKRPGA